VIFRPSTLAVTAVLAALGCGDGTDVHLGVGPPLQLVQPDGGGGSGGAAVDASDDAATCDDSTRVEPEVAAFLIECEGFGCNAIGGREGCRYEVTTSADAGPGSLREGLELVRPAWITFSADFDIILETNLVARSHKTLDGRNRRVTIRDFGIRIENAENIAIENITFLGRQDLDRDAGGVRKDDADAISLVGAGTHDVWIDHCDFSNYRDGLIDVSGGATNVTVSRSHFSDHEFVMLFGNDVDDVGAREMRVTVHHNWFQATKNYHPRARYGWIHVYNNLFDEWGDVGVRASQESRVYTEKNIYRAGDDSKEAVTFTKEGDDDKDGFVRAAGDDLKLNGAVVNTNDDGTVVMLPFPYEYHPQTADDGGDGGGLLEQRLHSEAGVQAPLP